MGISGASAHPRVRYFLYRPSRSRTVVEEVLGDEFQGVLVSDFYGAYNVYQGPHQRCWAHLLRRHPPLNEQYPQDSGAGPMVPTGAGGVPGPGLTPALR